MRGWALAVLAGGCANVIGIHDPSHQIDASVDDAPPPPPDARPDAMIDAAPPDAFVPVACAVRLNPRPHMEDLPNPVLNAADDPDTASGFQLTVVVFSTTTPAAINAQLFLDGAGQGNMALDPIGGGAIGNASVWPPLTLADGDHEIHAICTDGLGTQTESTHDTFTIDTVSPTCAFAAPASGVVVTPAADADTTTPAIDVAVSATVGGGDSDGEDVTFTAGTATASAPIAGGVAMTVFSPPGGALTLGMTARDLAGNPCTATEPIVVDYGCDVTLATDGPMAVVPLAPSDTTDPHLVLDVAPACAGDTVTLTCPNTDASASASTDAQPTVAFDINMSSWPIDRVKGCVATVTDSYGYAASSPILVEQHSLPGSVVVGLSPPLACGGTVTATADIDSGKPGVQILATMGSPDTTATLSLTDNGSPVLGEVTLKNGANALVASDGTNTSPTCAITLAGTGPSIAITGPGNGAFVGNQAGTVDTTADTLAVAVTGWTSTPDASVAISVDGGATSLAQVFPDGAFATTVTLAEGPHTLTALAGTTVATANILVDVTSPAIADFAATRRTRRSANLTWTPPAEPTTCFLKTDLAAVFNTGSSPLVASLVTPPLVVDHNHVGQRTFALGCFDQAGNSAQPTAGVLLDFTAGKTFTGATGFGTIFRNDVAIGNFDGDAIPDVAMTHGGLANGSVDVYLNKGTGTFNAPLAITQNTAGFSFPSDIAAIDYDHDGTDDLAIGSSGDSTNGAVYVLLHAHIKGGNFSADATLTVNGGGNEWTNCSGGLGPGCNLGSSVKAIDFDGDGEDELAIGVAGLNNGQGGALVLWNSSTGAIGIPASGIGYQLTGLGNNSGDWFTDVGVIGGHANAGLFGSNSVGLFSGASKPLAVTTVSSSVTINGVNPNSVGTIEDEDADGEPDLIIATSGTTYDATYKAGSVTAKSTFPGATWAASVVSGGDLDGDGNQDLLLLEGNRIDVFYGPLPPASYSNAEADQSATSLSGTPVEIRWVPDLNGDGEPDIVVITNSDATVYY